MHNFEKIKLLNSQKSHHQLDLNERINHTIYAHNPTTCILEPLSLSFGTVGYYDSSGGTHSLL